MALQRANTTRCAARVVALSLPAGAGRGAAGRPGRACRGRERRRSRAASTRTATPAAAGCAAVTPGSTAGGSGSTATGDGRFDRGEPSTQTRSRGGRSGSYSLRARTSGGVASLRAAPAKRAAGRWRTSGAPLHRSPPAAAGASGCVGGVDARRARTSAGTRPRRSRARSTRTRTATACATLPEFGLSGFRVWLDRDRDGVYDAGEPSDADDLGQRAVGRLRDQRRQADRRDGAAAPCRDRPRHHLAVHPARDHRTGTAASASCGRAPATASSATSATASGAHPEPPTTPGPQPPPRARRPPDRAAWSTTTAGSLGDVACGSCRMASSFEGSPIPEQARGSRLHARRRDLPSGGSGGGRIRESAAGDCDANGSRHQLAGFTASCSITVDDIAPTLTVITEVINDNGLSAGPATSRRACRTTGPFPAEVPGSPKTGSGTGAIFTVRSANS